MNPRFIFITGGVSSSLGKGIASSALGVLLQKRGFSVLLRKLDPYLNIDPGTMSPYQHGEVYVTEDGTEADLDLGHYERFTNILTRSTDYVTTGKIYASVLEKERKGNYLGATVQVIPHITDAIKNFITSHTEAAQFVLCEIGGTVGDIEGLPFLEAIRQLRHELGREHTMFVHLTLLPYIITSGELKTKPTQHSVKQLLSVGIQADLLLCRSHQPIPQETKNKIALFCNVHSDKVITALDAQSIYQVPLNYHEEGFDEQVCQFFSLSAPSQGLIEWHNLVNKLYHPQATITIAIVGKYVRLLDAYQSLIQALKHASLYHQIEVNLKWIDATQEPYHDLEQELSHIDGIIVPGGFGDRGIDTKIRSIQYARVNRIPFLGICFGMQLAVIEAFRNQLNTPQASSTEFGETSIPVIDLMTEWKTDKGIQKRSYDSDLGGTMRLGSYPCHIKENSKAYAIYQHNIIHERHRHRYEVNITYQPQLEEVGLLFSGLSPDQKLPEILERNDHPWFIGTQFHPELKSTVFHPHPLFCSFLEAALKTHKN